MIYKIKSIHFSDNDSVYLSADCGKIVMQYLIAYILFTFNTIANGFGLSPCQVGNILTNVYGFTYSNISNDCIYIDIFEIWETYCAAADLILNIKIFKNDKLSNELEKQLNYIIPEYESKENIK